MLQQKWISFVGNFILDCFDSIHLGPLFQFLTSYSVQATKDEEFELLSFIISTKTKKNRTATSAIMIVQKATDDSDNNLGE